MVYLLVQELEQLDLVQEPQVQEPQALELKEQAQQEQALLLEQEESKLGSQLLRIQVVVDPLRLQGVMLLLRVQITMSSTSL